MCDSISVLHELTPQTTCQPKYGDPPLGQLNEGPLPDCELQPVSPSNVLTLLLPPDQKNPPPHP